MLQAARQGGAGALGSLLIHWQGHASRQTVLCQCGQRMSSQGRRAKGLSRQDADLEEVALLISKDTALTKRLLRAANPTAKTEADYEIETVDEALMRSGLACALLLAMGTPLAQALVRTFQTMLSLKLESIDRHAAFVLEGQHLLGTIGFSGRAAGLV